MIILLVKKKKHQDFVCGRFREKKNSELQLLHRKTKLQGTVTLVFKLVAMFGGKRCWRWRFVKLIVLGVIGIGISCLILFAIYLAVGDVYIFKIRFNALLHSYVVHPNPPFHDTSALPWAVKLREHHAIILEELLTYERTVDIPALRLLDFEQGILDSSSAKEWKILFLVVFSRVSQEAVHHFPKTFEILRDAFPSLPHSVFFSVLDGGKVLQPHTGNYQGVLRYHLGLVVPKPGIHLPTVAHNRTSDRVRSRHHGLTSYLEIFPGRSITEAESCGKSCTLLPSERRAWAVGYDLLFGDITPLYRPLTLSCPASRAL